VERPPHDLEALQRMIETFEHELEQLHDRTSDPDQRTAISALRESWFKFVSVAFGPIPRVRTCASCKRSQLQIGLRCVFCWHRFATFDAPVPA
jgi:hypothetical protein